MSTKWKGYFDLNVKIIALERHTFDVQNQLWTSHSDILCNTLKPNKVAKHHFNFQSSL